MNKTKKIKEIIKNKNGITLVALVVTVVILLILAGVSLNLVLGEQGIIRKANEGRTNYLNASEEEYSLLNKLSDDIDTYARGGEKNPPAIEWQLVNDLDNDGVISIGDEIAPLISSIENEHFYVLKNNGTNVWMITKYCVDSTTNSQSPTAAGVTFDKAFYDPEQESVELYMKPGSKSNNLVHYVCYDSYGEIAGSYDDYEIYADGDTDTVTCTGLNLKNYESRLINSGLKLYEVYTGKNKVVDMLIYLHDGVFFIDSTDAINSSSPYINIFESLGECWLVEQDMISRNISISYVYKKNDAEVIEHTHAYANESYGLRPVIKVDINSIQLSD